jgi:non-specific serine/threonine protein kinase
VLSEPERALFRRLSVFVGGFSLDAAEAVAEGGRTADSSSSSAFRLPPRVSIGAGSSVPVLDGIASLVDKSLARQEEGADGAPRFSMLEMVREYGLEQLTANGEEPAIRDAHAHHFIMAAEGLWTAFAAMTVATVAEMEDGLRRLKPELGNFRTALAWTLEHAPSDAVRLAGALDNFWYRHGHFVEGRQWVERALAVATDVPAGVRARAVLVAGHLALLQEDFPPADAWLAEAVAGFRALGERRLLAHAFLRHGAVVLLLGDRARTRQIAEEAQEHALASRDPVVSAIIAIHLGRVAADMGDLARAETLLAEAVAGHRAFTGPYGLAAAQGLLGGVVLARGDAARAAGYYGEAVATFAAIGYWAGVPLSIERLVGATVARWPAPSTRLLGAMAALRERIGQPRFAADIPGYERTLRTARAGLDPADYADAWAAGARLSMDEAVAEALALAATASSAPTTAPAPLHGLTPRELEVLRLVAEGMPDRQIAEALSISPKTIGVHVSHILAKLGVPSRAAAVAFALRNGLA